MMTQPEITSDRYFKWTVELLEDLHTGTGTGAGEIDALIYRNRKGLPTIPFSHLKGVLKESAAEIAQADPSWQASFVKLFGHGGAQQKGLNGYALTPEPEQSPQTLLWQSSAREQNSRRPAEKSLRTLEYLAAGTQLSGQLMIEQATPADIDLLKLTIERTDRLGAHRTRGDGLIRTELTEVSMPSPFNEPLDLPKTAPLILRVVWEALDPVRVSQTGQPSNFIATESYLPATTLRGALMRWALQRDLDRAQQLLNSTQWSLGSGLPLPFGCQWQEHLRTLQVIPIPLSLQASKPKAENTQIPHWVANQSDRQRVDRFSEEGQSTTEKLKRAGDSEYLYRANPEKGAWQLFSPLRRDRLHAGREGENQTLYVAEELTEATCFVSDIRFESATEAEQFLQTFAPLLQQRQWLIVGRGGAPLVAQGVAWMTPPATPALNGESFIITLTSDLIARDNWLNFYDQLTPELLCQLTAPTPSEESESDTSTVHSCQFAAFNRSEKSENDLLYTSFSDSTVHYRFNGATGLPAVAKMAIRRGSTLKMVARNSAQQAILQQLWQRLTLLSALGEESSWGLGRFLLQQRPIVLESRVAVVPSRPSSLEQSAVESVPLATELAEVRLSSSQWQWLRSQIKTLRNSTEQQRLFAELLPHHSTHLGGQAWAEVIPRLQAFAGEGAIMMVKQRLDTLIRTILVQQHALKKESPQ